MIESNEVVCVKPTSTLTFNKLYTVLANYNYEYKLRNDNDRMVFVLKNRFTIKKPDDVCAICFSENDDKCYSCWEQPGYPNFLSEEKYKGTTEKTKEESTCGECTNLDLETFSWPCNSCNISNNFKYFSKNKGRLCTTCRYNPNCNRECDSDYSHWEPIEPKNRSVELPFGIKETVVFQHPDFKGRQWNDITDAINNVRLEKLAELLETLAEFNYEDYLEDDADVVAKILDTLATNIANDPTKHFELFKEILEEKK